MTLTSLLNRPVAVLVSDPWEFGVQCGIGPFVGTVVGATSELLIVRLSEPILYTGSR